MFEKYYRELLNTVSLMNNHATRKKDLLRNHVNYGAVITLEKILHDMGHEVDTCVYGDGDYLISAKIELDGKTIITF